MYRLDRTSFSASKIEDNKGDRAFWLSQSVDERLKAAMYLQSINFNFKLTALPKMDRAAFSMRKHG